MIIPSYEVRPTADGRGKGVYLLSAVRKGQVVIAPDQVNRVCDQQERETFLPGSIEDDACIRWFENWYTTSPDWPDDCFINHSFEPSGLWHLGFIFAMRDLQAGEELTVNYEYLVGDGEELPFTDTATGRKIVGKAWYDNITESTTALLALLVPDTDTPAGSATSQIG